MEILMHIGTLLITSLIATVFLFPVSALDVYYAASFNHFNVTITFIIIILCDMLTAWLTYKASAYLIPKIIKKESVKRKFDKMGEALNKWGWWGLVIAGATPLPYSIFLYACGAVQWGDNFKLLTAVALGRTIKYASLTVGIIYGWRLFG